MNCNIPFSNQDGLTYWIIRFKRGKCNEIYKTSLKCRDAKQLEINFMLAVSKSVFTKGTSLISLSMNSLFSYFML